MNTEQLKRMEHGMGFIAALDQSGGSTPKALLGYGISEDAYDSEEKMYDLVQEMRSRIITSQAFTSEHILGAILFEKTMDRKIDGLYTSDYLWEKKGILPILKVDKGLAEEENGVRLMKPMPQLDELLARGTERHIFGTKMRSVIHEANREGIHNVVVQQFEYALRIEKAGMVPIMEPEVDINSTTKQEAEDMLIAEIRAELKKVDPATKLMFKVTIPSKANAYSEIMDDPRVVRVVALSGGYTRKHSVELLEKNERLIASFSRALLSELSVTQTQEEFDAVLSNAIQEIYDASIK